MDDFYTILEIRHDATISEIKLAYKKLIYKYHPDINKNNSERFKQVTKAYKVLSDPISRLNYDKEYTKSKIKGSLENREDSSIRGTKQPKEIPKKGFSFMGIKRVFDAKKIENFFNNIKKARHELKKKRFIDREKEKVAVSSNEEMFDFLSDTDLLARLKTSSNNLVRAHAARIIGRKKDHRYVFELIKAISDSSYLVRKEAIRALGIIKDYRAVNFIINASYDYEDEVRIEVAKILRNFEDTRVISCLLRMMKDRNEKVICESIYSLGVIGEHDAIVEIRRFLRHEVFAVRKAALEVIKMAK